MRILSGTSYQTASNAAGRRGVVPTVAPLSRRDLLARLCAVPLAGQDRATFSANVKVVNLLATVRNHKGEIVRDLVRDDFLLEEDGRPQTIRYFSQENGLPLTLGLLVDTSASQVRLLGAEREASHRFVRQVLREDKDLAFVIHFDHEVELLQDVTASREKLEKALGLLTADVRGPRRGQGVPGGRGRGRRGGGTILYDAVTLASDDLMKKQSGRKAVVLLSDGVDTGSKLSLSTAIESAQKADTLVYSVLFADTAFYGRPRGGYGRRGGWGGRHGRVGVSGAVPDGKKVLQRLARETGGGFFEVSSKTPLQTVYSRIEEELRHQYSLGYEPDRPSPGFHAIRLGTRNKAHIVQTRAGYFMDSGAASLP